MKKLLDREVYGNHSNKSDEELERLYYEGNTRASRDAENKLYDRGYTLDSNSDTWDLASNQNDTHSVGIPIPTGQGTFLLFLAILIGGLIAFSSVDFSLLRMRLNMLHIFMWALLYHLYSCM